MRNRRLEELRDRITSQVFGHWWVHRTARTPQAAPHLHSALGAAGRARGQLAQRWLPEAQLRVEARREVLWRVIPAGKGGIGLPGCLLLLLRNADGEVRRA